MSDRPEHDALVVGAGLAGLWTARALARRGVRVLLIDHKRDVGTSIATTGIFVRRSLECFELPAQCLGPPVRVVKLHAPSGKTMALESQHDEFRVGRMGQLYRHLLASAVADGVRWSPATHFLGCDQTSNGSRVFLRVNGRRNETTTRFLLGADGARSRVAPALGLDRNSSSLVGVEEVMADVPPEGKPSFHCFLDPEIAPGYLGWLVHDGDEVHLGVAGDPARFDPRSALETLKMRASNVVALSRGRLVERRGGWIPVNGVLRRIVNSRGMLLGDAAGAVSPLTAGGLDPCLRLSELAARQVAAYLLKKDQAALDQLQGRHFRREFRGRLALRRVWSGIETRWVMELACAMLRTPPGRWIARQVFFRPASFPDRRPADNDAPFTISLDGAYDHGSRTANAASPVSAG